MTSGLSPSCVTHHTYKAVSLCYTRRTYKRMSHVTNCCRCGGSCYDDPTSSQLFLHPGYMHNAVLQPLQPARRYCCSFTSHVARHTSHVTLTRRYYYSFGSSLGGWSQVYSFLAPRVAGDTTAFTFLYEQHFAVQCWAASARLTGVQVHCRCRRGTAVQAGARRRLPQRRPAQWSRQGVCSHYKGCANETG